eukprot:GILI01025971.1.p1 GENE.GILI01025971.1~~GILI01025971.1.p1  ORF type:complete len:191 (-),score=22.91 GILI01025971.1:53-625(-)
MKRLLSSGFPASSSLLTTTRQSFATSRYLHQKSRDAQTFTYRDETAKQVAITIKTKCGRVFESIVFRQAVEASQDELWLEAIRRGMQQDSEYMTAIKEKGGVAPDIKELLAGEGMDDAAFFEYLRIRLVDDYHFSLCLCALQNSFTEIRKHRDQQQSKRLASSPTGDREDPMTLFKKAQEHGGSRRPPMF